MKLSRGIVISAAVCMLTAAISVYFYLTPVSHWAFIPPVLIQIIRVLSITSALYLLLEKVFKLQIFTKIFLSLFLGALAGILFQQTIAEIKPIGTAFIRLIQMVVIPLVFASLLVGTASLGDPRKLGRIGAKTLLYFLVYTIFAAFLGLFLANLFQPGSGLPSEVQKQLLEDFSGKAGESVARLNERGNFIDTILNIIPTNPMASLSQSDLLQIIFFSMFTGTALALIPKKKAEPVIHFFEGINDAMVRIVQIAIKLAPYGVFALIASVVGSFGLDILFSLLKYSLITIGGLIFLNFTYPVVVRIFSGMSMGTFLKGIRAPQLIAFSTSSSSATLPVTMEACEKNLGVPREICGFILPLGATINMNGTALYQGISAVFIAQVYGLGLTLSDQILIVLTATLASVGAAGAPGAGMLMLVIVLKQIGIPLEGISLILGVERILDMFRTVLNITGDTSAAVVISKSEGELRIPKK